MMIRPSGPHDPLAAITAVITFARSAAGGRAVMIPMIGAFTIGTKRPQSTTAMPTTGHGTGRDDDPERERRRDDPEAASFSGANLSSSFITSTEPVIAPMPNAVKIHPAMCGSRSVAACTRAAALRR